jgi:CheY-like chemotaxis protein
MNKKPRKKLPRVILVAEDDDDDFYLLRCAFENAQLPHSTYQVRDGHHAMDYLRGTGAFRNRRLFPKADLLILDLKMPGMDGYDVLAALRRSRTLAKLPVVVLSGSFLSHDEERVLSLGARAFYVKSAHLAQSSKTIIEICRKWLGNGAVA